MAPTLAPELQHLVAGFDFDVLGVRALEAAITVARSRGNVQVHAIYVRPSAPLRSAALLELVAPHEDDSALRARIDHIVASCLGKPPRRDVEVVSVVRDGACAAVLIEEARALGAALIVIGSHGRGALARFLEGSVAEEVVRDAPCPVLVVHAHDCATSEGDAAPALESTAPA
ncbi:MAG: universal stress protein [Polyangiales bacterium]